MNKVYSNMPKYLDDVISIQCGDAYTVVLKTTGKVIAWGLNNVGQTNVPKNLDNVINICCGDAYNVALKSDGTVVA
jgi:alpha-tubulin suppressor-like RCC1 family protein